MSEMSERIARKLEPQAWAALGIGDTLAYKNRRTSSLRKAKLVLEAMREPTEGMVEAGSHYEGLGRNEARWIWGDMIARALSESK